jgi:hypothetical protein
MVLVLSTNSAASRQVAREVERADALHLPLVTVRLDGTELAGDLEYFLSNTQWLDVSRDRIQEHLAPLPRYIRLLLSSRRDPVERVPAAVRSERATDEVHAVVTSWFAVFARGHEVAKTFALQEPDTLMFALRFGFYMVLVGALISFPVSAAARSRPMEFLIAYVVSSVVEITGIGLLMHTAFRLVGGTAALTSSMTAWCLYTAFWPVMVISLAPVNAYLAPAFEGRPVTRLEELAVQLSPGGVLVLFVSFLASTAAVLMLVGGVLRTFQALHNLSGLKAAVAALLALVGCVAYLFVLAFPFARSLYL